MYVEAKTLRLEKVGALAFKVAPPHPPHTCVCVLALSLLAGSACDSQCAGFFTADYLEFGLVTHCLKGLSKRGSIK